MREMHLIWKIVKKLLKSVNGFICCYVLKYKELMYYIFHRLYVTRLNLISMSDTLLDILLDNRIIV